MPILYTIGFTKKSAKKFFNSLIDNNVKKIIDTRINNKSQLAGFAKHKDLEFLLEKIGGIQYSHEIKFAPTKDLLERYRKKEISWDAYTYEYLKLIEERRIIDEREIREYR